MEGLHAFKIWKALWAHFHTWEYDAVKYNGRINGAMPSDLDKKLNKSLFVAFERKFSRKEDIGNYLIANFALGDYSPPFIVTDDQDENFIQWRKRKESRSYIFNNDIDYLERILSSRKMPLLSGNNQCLLFSEYISGRISPESVCILDKEFGVAGPWRNTLTSSLFSDIILRLCKYNSFISYDRDKCLGGIDKFKEISRDPRNCD